MPEGTIGSIVIMTYLATLAFVHHELIINSALSKRSLECILSQNLKRLIEILPLSGYIPYE